MYEAFDRFLIRETWHTAHPTDEKAFFQALNTIVDEPSYHPDEMGSYFRSRISSAYDRENHPMESAVSHYVSAGWAVKDFLAATGR